MTTKWLGRLWAYCLLAVCLVAAPAQVRAGFLVTKWCDNLYLFPPDFTDREKARVRIKGVSCREKGKNSGACVDTVEGIFKVSFRPDEVFVEVRANDLQRCAADSIETDFAKLRILLDGKEMSPADRELVASRVAEMIPVAISPPEPKVAQLPDVLRAAYGFQTVNGRGGVELRPGMRLRVEYADFLNVGKPDINGYAGMGVGHYGVSRGHNGNIVFDSFLGHLGLLKANPSESSGATSGEESKPAPPPSDDVAKPTPSAAEVGAKAALNPHNVCLNSPKWVGGVVDLPSGDDGFPYYSLVYPNNILPGGKQYKQPDHNYVVLLGAQNFCTLRCLLRNIGKTAPASDTCACGSTTEAGMSCYVFRGRDVIVPEIEVFVRGEPVFMPLGTTVADVARQAQNWSSEQMLKKVKLRRVFRGEYATVDFRGCAEALSLPLLKGDSITW